MGVYVGDEEIDLDSLPDLEISAAPETTWDFSKEVMTAAFQRENPVASYLARDRERHEAVEGYNPYKIEQGRYFNLLGYEQFADDFAGSESPDETEQIKRSLDRQMKNAQVMTDAGWWGVGASFVAGFMDPINFIPPLKVAKTSFSLGRSALKSAGLTAASGVGASILSEAALHSTQETRTIGESALNIGSTAVLSGVLGGAVGYFSAKQLRNAVSATDRVLDLPDPGKPDPMVVPARGSDEELAVFSQMEKQHDSDADLAMRNIVDDADDGTFDAEFESRFDELEDSSPFRVAGATLTGARFLNPALNTMIKSPSRVVRNAVENLVPLNLLLNKNIGGLRTGNAAATLMTFWEAGPGQMAELTKKLHAKHRKAGGSYSKYEIRQLATKYARGRTPDEMLADNARAESTKDLARAGDMADQPSSGPGFRGEEPYSAEAEELANAWHDTVFTPMGKELEKLDMYHAGQNKTSERKVPRVWIQKEVRENYHLIKGIAKADLIKKHGIKHGKFDTKATKIGSGGEGPTKEPMTIAEIDEAASKIMARIQGLAPGRVDTDHLGIKSGPSYTRELSFDVDDTLVAPFVENDLGKIGTAYSRTVGAIIEVRKKYGDVDLKTGVSETLDNEAMEEYAKLLDTVPQRMKNIPGEAPEAYAKRRQKANDKLNKQHKTDLNNLHTWVRLLLGHTGREDRFSSLHDYSARAANLAINTNNLTKMGMATISSLSDAARPWVTHGFANFLRGDIIPSLIDREAHKLAKHELKARGVGWQTAISTVEARWDMGGDFPDARAFENGVSAAARASFKLSLLSQWTDMWTVKAGVVSQARILKAVDELMEGGKMSPKDVRDLAKMGIGQEEAELIGHFYKMQGSKGWSGVRLANSLEWVGEGSEKAKDIFGAAIVKDAFQQISRPGPGQIPNFAFGLGGRTFFQYRRFPASASTDYTFQLFQDANLSFKETAWLSGSAAMIAAGIGSHAIHQAFKGKEVSDNPLKLIGEGVDRSGILGMLPEIHNIIEKGSSGRIGYNAMIGEEPMSRYQSRNLVGAVAGPSLSLAYDGAVAGVGLADLAMTGDPMSDAEIRSTRRIVPLQNHFLLRKLFDKVQESTTGNAYNAERMK